MAIHKRHTHTDGVKKDLKKDWSGKALLSQQLKTVEKQMALY